MAHTLDPSPDHEIWMDAALAEAWAALSHGDVPIGAVVVADDGTGPTIIASRHNEREHRADPTAHAELLAIRDAAEVLGQWRLSNCIVVVTLEPCPMCAGALWASRIGGVVIGTDDPKAGATGSLYHLGQDPRLNHEYPVRVGVRAEQCAELLRSFFADRR